MTDMKGGEIYSNLNTCSRLCKKVKMVFMYPRFNTDTEIPDVAILKLKTGFSLHYFDNWPLNILEFPKIFDGIA